MSVIKKTEKYGLIGHPLGHSLSPYIHNKLMKSAGIESEYELIDVEPGSFLQEIPSVLSRYKGLNCTIPYKERIISLLDSLDEYSATLRSVNTILNSRGYNTDREGFLNDGPALYDRSVMILGAGGVSRMLSFAAAGEKASRIAIWARRLEQAERLALDVHKLYPDQIIDVLNDPDELEGINWVLLQGTPAGMWPQTGELPLPEDKMQKLLGKTIQVYDTIYNPVATRLVLMARSMGIPASGGLGMLFAQALAAQRIWHPQAIFNEDVLASIQESLSSEIFRQFPTTIVFTGFMGSGKSTIGEKLASYINLPLIDLDIEIEKDNGKTINQIFNDSGEAGFRKKESEMLEKFLGADRSQILATGGGALMSDYNQKLLRQKSALVIYLQCPLPEIRKRLGQGKGRPLWQDSQSDELQKLYDRRQGIYQTVADRIISADQDPDQLVAALAADLGYGGKMK